MNLLEEARSILETAGFRTIPEVDSVGMFYFEDESVLGSVFVHDSANELLSQWETSQDRFLGRNSSKLRRDPIKVWNIYTIHLTADELVENTSPHPFEIEQDFRGTRKIVQSGVKSKIDVKEALLPLLELQHRASMSPKQVKERLRRRLTVSSHILADLLEDKNAKQIADDLVEEQ